MRESTGFKLKQQTGLLERMNCAGYYQNIAAKSAIGRENPNITKEPTHALACFFVGKTCTHAFFTVWSFSYLLNGNPQFMAVRAGQLSGWPGSFVTGFSPLFGLPPMSVRTPSGSKNLLTKEAAIMATIPSTRLPEISVINGKVVTSSLTVADYFGKRHDDVLRKIANLECSPEFNARNFAVVEYVDLKGETRPAFNITRDGFTFLAMGFTGKRAAAFKEAYIAAFNAMEAQLLNPLMFEVPPFPDVPFLKFNARSLVSTLLKLRAINEESLYPMLVSAQSPFAPYVTGLLNDAVFIAMVLQKEIEK